MPNPWRVVFLLCVVSCVGYLVRADVAVAQERMVPALGLTMTAMGAITAWGFQLAYAVFQVPAGVIGERVGARTALMLGLLGCSVASIATGLMPQAPAGAIPALWTTRVLLGIAQASIFPVAAMAVTIYVPTALRVRATSFYISTSVLGAAMAPLLMAPVMEWYGWRAVFVLSGIIAAATAIAWRLLMPPPAIDATLAGSTAPGGSRRELLRLLANPSLRRLSLAYLLHSAVWFVFLFWFFRYLIEGRGFTVLASGVWGSLPSIAGFVCAPLVGVAVDRFGVRVSAGRSPAGGDELPAGGRRVRRCRCGAAERGPRHRRAQPGVGVHQRRRSAVLRHGDGHRRQPSGRRRRLPQPDGQPWRRVLDLARAAHGGGLGLDLDPGVLVDRVRHRGAAVAGTVQVDGARPVPAMA